MKNLSTQLAGTWQLIHDYYQCKQEGIIVEERCDITTGSFMAFCEDATGSCRGAIIDWELSGNKLRIVRTEDSHVMDMVVERLTCDRLVVSKSGHYVEDGVTCDEYYSETYKRMN